MIFFKLVQAEFLKTKKIPILGLYSILVVGSIAIFFIFFYNKTFKEFVNEHLMEANPNPWYAYYFKRYLLLSVFFLPLIISVTTYIIKNIEDKADAWKRLFVLPYSREIIHLSKLSVIWLYTTLYVVMTFSFLMLSGILLSKLKPDFNFSAHHTYHEFLFIFCLKFEVAVVSIATFSYAYMIWVKRTVVSLLLSIFLPFVGLIFPSPYSSPLYQTHTFNRSVHEMLINSQSHETLHLKVIGSHDFLCIAIMVLSFVAIVWASKNPVVNYE